MPGVTPGSLRSGVRRRAGRADVAGRSQRDSPVTDLEQHPALVTT